MKISLITSSKQSDHLITKHANWIILKNNEFFLF